MAREEHRSLTGRVAGADDVDVEPVGHRRLAAGYPVRHAFTGQSVGLDPEPPPGDSTGDDDRPGTKHVVAVQIHLAGFRVDPLDCPRDEYLGTESSCLLERAVCELVARYSGREAEIVLDPRRGPRLSPWGVSLDDHDPEPLGRAVYGGRQPGRTGADDDDVVVHVSWFGFDVQQFRDAPQSGSRHPLSVDDP